ncbi:MAG TPA: ferredoxin--NADP reductase, partial [Gammaproteobacteria bacterium]|nr:ferredoxin--NADP reductase [Gammaproteobacteria bacterium]
MSAAKATMNASGGVVPFHAMLPELDRRARVTPFRVTILMGVRAPTERLYYQDFVRFAECTPDAR